MKAEVTMMSEDFTLYDLKTYIQANFNLKKIADKRLIDRDIVLSECYRQVDTNVGDSFTYASSTEDAAIKLDSIERGYEREENRIRLKSEMLNNAVQSLSRMERYTYNVAFLGDDNFLNIPAVDLEGYGKRLGHKLCEHIGRQRKEYKKQKDKNRLQELKPLRAKQIEQIKRSLEEA